MANPPLASNAMTVPLAEHSFWRRTAKLPPLSRDLAPCDIAAPKTKVTCIACQKPGSLRCSGCHDAEYCSADCQHSDWDVHKLVCRKLSSFCSEPRPSKEHFRVLIFPYQASSPEFCWGVFKKHEYDAHELEIMHSTIDSWRAATKGQYYGSDDSNLIIRALSRDTATQGKTLGHAVKTASWKPSNKSKSHLSGFNETVLALAGPLSRRFYGPLVSFAYNVDNQFYFETMDDISAADFGALIDVFHNSDWNPIVGRVERYPAKTTSALFLPDHFNFHRMNSPYTETIPKSPDELSISHIIGTEDEVIEVTITSALDSKQLCRHNFCVSDVVSIIELCLNGRTSHVLLLGPLLLDLPWIGRISWITDEHDSVLEYRWQESRSRFLRRGIVLCYKLLGIDHIRQGDGLMVFNAFGVRLSPLHLIAYDEFMFCQLQTDKSKRQLSKLGFLSFWNDLKSGRVKITKELKKPQYSQLRFLEFWEDSEASEANTTNQIELDFSKESCPYDCPADVKQVLTQDESQVFLYVRKLFRDPDFVRANQRDWLEILHDANVVVQDRALGPAYWDDELDKFFTDHIADLIKSEST
ncbi:uncharacterized protein FTJAE_1539 [Fusarium tjaetaba]|uniref:MYND-type domain-containing protein n=1 Tax=Fusarium tjaetaba TaxID=1567544 RepID=A0A8H5SC61_9HYPO|nr:uncharacterized protein FTJAE_1539 [Fusarium tjaetaba]KAF5647856.1 hypothetical protein FTJAE_1539 [Fusarium tjaetaba]